LGALGVVYGDIGTSPLYAVRECLHGMRPTEEAALGITSLIAWALILVIVVKYLGFIIRADNNGEGGILALLALTPRGRSRVIRRWTVYAGLLGAALLIADGLITPAISVLGAVEGLKEAAPGVSHFAMPIAAMILLLLFSVQRFGTGRISVLFGPVVLVWFLSMAASGVSWIVAEPRILLALDPRHALGFMVAGPVGFFVLGGVVLCVTGAEALYADLGHFGRRSVRLAWSLAVFPCLLLSYFGQGAYLLTRVGHEVGNPFYEMVPTAFRYPMIAIATLAAIVASQALISGVYSLVQQAVQLGYLPRVTILHTSSALEGRIYLPQINFLLLIGCVFLVVVFQSSSGLAAAYGVAVTGTMAMTSLLYVSLVRPRWGWPIAATVGFFFLLVDLAFFAANLPKLASGGWIPLAIGTLLLILMTTWRSGAEVVGRQVRKLRKPLDVFLGSLDEMKVVRTPGSAVCLTREEDGAPLMFTHFVERVRALHEQVIFLHVRVEHVPRIEETQRFESTKLSHGFQRVTAHYGFMETPDLGQLLRRFESEGLPVVAAETTVFVGHSTVVLAADAPMARWRKKVFEELNRVARSASAYYRLPAEQVVELGVRVEI
jgi:KUP system potassium uptake protein